MANSMSNETVDNSMSNVSNNSLSNVSNNSKYYACNDPNRPICRAYVNQSKCNRNNHCNFYHPRVITQMIKKKARREPGFCYCGSLQRTIIANRVFRRSDEDDAPPTFFIICSRTGKSMKKCINL